ncbi:very short patch repair endonuclease [Lachnospiraceae bacterium ZAX-1]
MDRMTKEQRHKTMSHVKSRDTKIELALRKALWRKGIRYRKNYKKLPGSPDIVLTKYKIAVFCDGEFFHGYKWGEKKDRLDTNRDYWIKKIERNMQRDRENEQALRFLDWTVLRFWGYEILKSPQECIRTVEEAMFEKEIAFEKEIKIFDDTYMM